jgi:hypothetical protein
MESLPHEERDIRLYMELECPEEKITHLEKVATERVFGMKHDVWDVHTDQGRWWVITDPTNLYRQPDFHSMDMAVTFHLGLRARMIARQDSGVSEEEKSRLSATIRRWEQAADALENADEAEEFQAVGMRCRECLLSLVGEATDPSMVPPGREAPKEGDFVHWAEHLADAVAGGSSSDRIRGYLKAVATRTWELVGWLTHAANATREDGQFALDATIHVVNSFAGALVRKERKAPERCPKCSSYRLTSDYRPEINREPPYVTLCEACGWEDLPPPKRRKRTPRTGGGSGATEA